MFNRWITFAAFIFIVYAISTGYMEEQKKEAAEEAAVQQSAAMAGSTATNNTEQQPSGPTAEEKILNKLRDDGAASDDSALLASQMKELDAPDTPPEPQPAPAPVQLAMPNENLVSPETEKMGEAAQEKTSGSTAPGAPDTFLSQPTRPMVTIDEKALQNFEGSFLERKAVNVLTLLAKTPEGKEFLENLFSKPGDMPCGTKNQPITNFDGIKFIDLSLGAGRSAVCGDKATITYVIRNEKDQSLDEGSKTIRLGDLSVLKGLEQAVVGMQVNGKRKVYIPPHLAFDMPEFRTEAVPKGQPVYAEISLQDLVPMVGRHIPHQYDMLQGTGEPVMCGDTIPIHYRLSKLDGGVLYDSKERRREPLALRVGNMSNPRAFVLGVEKMRFGGKRTIIVPPKMLRAGTAEITHRFIPPSVELNDQAYVLDIEVLQLIH